MTEAHDPRPVTCVVIPLYVEIIPARDSYAMRYIGGAVHEIVDSRIGPDGERSMERVSPEDIANTIMGCLRRDLDSMWVVRRIAPLVTCRPEGSTPELERVAHERYEEAKTAGLSDPEPRAGGWPDRRAEGIGAIRAEIERWAAERDATVHSNETAIPFADLAERLFGLRPAWCPYDCDSCHDDECPCDRSGCAGGADE